ncbi:hypothetical protein [Campylobacter concisus]
MRRSRLYVKSTFALPFSSKYDSAVAFATPIYAAGKSGVSMSIVPLLSTNNVPAPRATMSLVLVPSSKFKR